MNGDMLEENYDGVGKVVSSARLKNIKRPLRQTIPAAAHAEECVAYPFSCKIYHVVQNQVESVYFL